MNRKIVALGVVLGSLALLTSPALKEKWILWRAPKLTPEALKQSPLSLAEQSNSIVDWEKLRCDLVATCLNATNTHDASQVDRFCSAAEEGLLNLRIPKQLPEAVQAHLEIYLQSSINTVQNLSLRWAKANRTGSGRRTNYFTFWEIDTCGTDSLPQKLFRIYGLKPAPGKSFLDCEEIKRL